MYVCFLLMNDSTRRSNISNSKFRGSFNSRWAILSLKTCLTQNGKERQRRPGNGAFLQALAHTYFHPAENHLSTVHRSAKFRALCVCVCVCVCQSREHRASGARKLYKRVAVAVSHTLSDSFDETAFCQRPVAKLCRPPCAFCSKLFRKNPTGGERVEKKRATRGELVKIRRVIRSRAWRQV